MKLIGKLIQIDKNDKKYLDKLADNMGMSANQLIRMIIKNYIKERK